LFSLNLVVDFRKGRREIKEGRKQKKRDKPPPQLRRRQCLRIASRMSFLPGPWNHRSYGTGEFIFLQRIGR
jgi:hypothetical protein